MKWEAMLIAAAASMVFAGAARAADDGAVKSLSDLDGGAKDYVYIYPHANFEALPPNAYTNVPPVHGAPNSVRQPIQADVPLDTVSAKNVRERPVDDSTPR